MKSYFFILVTAIIASCGTASPDKNEKEGDSIDIKTALGFHASLEADSALYNDTTNYDHATYFVLVADTNLEYSVLRKEMFDINEQLNIPIDTMGRFYNKTKNLIALPDNDADVMYAGDYFPRRFPSSNLSLEYLDFYQRKSREKTIALVAGIYETEKSADSALTALQKNVTRAFKIKADIYVGCMH